MDLFWNDPIGFSKNKMPMEPVEEARVESMFK
jgi:hypothetical protein